MNFGVFMSLIQGVITENFILVGADKRGIRCTGEISENCNKLIKYNDDIIFGCTGGILDNFKLFDGFCGYSDQTGLVHLDKQYDISYNNFVQQISSKFDLMYSEIQNDIKSYDIGSLIAGFNGKEFEITTFGIGSEDNEMDGIYHIHRSPSFPYKVINFGKIEHMNKIDEMLSYQYQVYGDLNIRQCKNIMLTVFNQAAKTDNTINNKLVFAKIRKKDVVK